MSGKTPDRFPGECEDEGIILDEATGDPVVAGGLRFVGGSFKMRDSDGVFNPRTGGALDFDDILFETSGKAVLLTNGNVVMRS